MGMKFNDAPIEEENIQADDVLLFDDASGAALKNIELHDMLQQCLPTNLIKNYPSIERADGAEPEWWGSTNATLTEEGAAGEGLGNSPNRRVLKVVTSGAGGLINQNLSFVMEALLYDGRPHSAGVWVYVVTAGTVTLTLAGTGGTWVQDTTTTTGSWVYLEATNRITSGSTIAQLRVSHSANSATFYVANPMVNVGAVTMPYKPRGLVYRQYEALLVNGTDPGGANTSVGITGLHNPAIVDLVVGYSNATTAEQQVSWHWTSSVTHSTQWNVLRTRGASAALRFSQVRALCGDDEIVYIDTNSVGGDTELLYVASTGYWAWEGSTS